MLGLGVHQNARKNDHYCDRRREKPIKEVIIPQSDGSHWEHLVLKRHKGEVRNGMKIFCRLIHTVARNYGVLSPRNLKMREIRLPS